MIYLSGVTNDTIEAALLAHGVGLICQPGNGYGARVDRYRHWAADNGCFRAQWDELTWLRWLEKLPRERCLFAVAPDVYPDAAATLRRSLEFAPLIRELGFPVALVAQDGAENLAIPWPEIDCLFIGGERLPDPRREWKVGEAARGLAREARRQGKWVHMGRVNGLYRLERAREMGCHSADGTIVKYGYPGQPNFRAEEPQGWVAWLEANPTLPNHLEAPEHPNHREALL
jgi:hypothetical protein